MKTRPSLCYRISIAGISAIYFFTNVAAVHASESTFWAERRRASFQKVRGEEELSTGRISTNPSSQMLLAQLPHASPMEMGRSFPPRNAVGPNDKKGPFSIGPKAGDWLGKLVMPYGSVNDLYLSPKPDAPFIVHIQDAHGIEEAQRNIAAMIGLLTQEPGIQLVGLEGAEGPFSLAPYRDFPTPEMTKDVADFFLKKGLIAGPEYAGLTLPVSPQFFGAENNALYLSNVQALKSGYKEKESAMATLSTLKNETEQLKVTVYSKSLKIFDKHFESYHADKEKLADYVRYLVNKSPSHINCPPTPNLHLLVKALDEEYALDFKRVETERTQLVERLVEKLTKPDLQDLVDKSVDYRAGRMGYGDYHTHLRKICLDHKIALAEFPQLSRYISYVLLADEIDRKDLLNEMDSLERALPESLAKSSEEKKLVSLAHDLVLLNKLLRHEMTTIDWTAYQTRREDIYRFGARLAELNPTQAISTAFTKEILKPFEDFCSYAVQRNTSLTDNFSRELAQAKTNSGILVAGGFHTEGLSALLRQRQISYVVVTPKITNVPNDNRYLDILAKDPVPLEQLLTGDRIYLSDAIALASNSDKAKTLLAIKDLLVGNLGKSVQAIKGLAVTTERPSPENLIGEMSAHGIKVYFVRNYNKGSSILNWAKSQAEKIKSTYLKVSILGPVKNFRREKNLRSALQQMRSWLARHHQWEAFAATGMALGFSLLNVSLIVMGGFAVGLVFLHLWFNFQKDYAQYQINSSDRNQTPMNKSTWIYFYIGSGLLVIPLLFAAYAAPAIVDSSLSLHLNFLSLALGSGLTGILTYQFLHSPWDHWARAKGFLMKAALFNSDTDFSKPSGNMVQEARLELIREQEGILDPSLPICKEVDALGRAALISLGLPAKEYAIIVSDSDEVNAMFYGVKDEKVIVFNRGLLVKLKEEGLFDRDSILFILGHEGGHALQKVREEQDKDYKPSGLIAEYDADEKGLNALDAGVDGTSFSPRAGLRVMDIFKKGRKTNSYTLTHPHPHRRLAKMFNDIRRKYWRKLDAIPTPLNNSLLDTERTDRFDFDRELYSILSTENLEKMALKARSLNDIQKISNLHHAFTVFISILESFNSPDSPTPIDLSSQTIQPMLNGSLPPSDGASFVLKWMNDQKINPIDLYPPSALDQLKNEYPQVLWDNNLLSWILAEQASRLIGKLRDVENQRQLKRILSHSFAPVEQEDSALRIYLQEKIQLQNDGQRLRSLLQDRARSIFPEIAKLSPPDQDQVVDLFILDGFNYLKEMTMLVSDFLPKDDTVASFYENVSWDDPAGVLMFILSTKRVYSNNYVQARTDDPIMRYIADYEKNEVGPNIRKLITDKYFSLVPPQLKGENISKDFILRLYQTFKRYRNTRSDSYEFKASLHRLFFQQISSELQSFEEFIRVFGDENDPHFLGDIAEFVLSNSKGKAEFIQNFTTLIHHDNLWQVAIYLLPYFSNRLHTNWNVSPAEGINILDQLLGKINVREMIDNPDFCLFRNGYLESIETSYGYWIELIPNVNMRMETAARLYAKENHDKESPYFSEISRLQKMRSLELFVDTSKASPAVLSIRKSLDRENIEDDIQLMTLISKGIIADHNLWDAIKTPNRREEIFVLLQQSEPLFLQNHVSQDQFDTLVSMVAWAWFYKPPRSSDGRGGLGENSYAWLNDFSKRLRPSIFNERALEKIKNLLSSSPPRNQAEWDAFFKFSANLRSPLNSKDISGIRNSSGGKMPPVWGWAKENPKGHPALTWGDDLFAEWLSQNMDSSLETTLEVILKCYPEPSEYRNFELISRIGNPLRDDPEKFRSILPHLQAGPLREILAKRLIELDLPAQKNSLRSLADVDAFLMTYFPNESEIKTEIRDQLLQDIEMSVDELLSLQAESAIERASRSSAMGIGHRVLETLADMVEKDPPAAKREAFEWLIGIHKQKPAVISSYENNLNVDLTDLPVLLSLATETDRYLFLTTLFLGPTGLLSDETERRTLLENIFSHEMNQQPQGSMLFDIFYDTFEACPELKRLDLVNGIFRHFLGSETSLDSTPSTLIRSFLSSFGLVGTKLGQILSKNSALPSELREVLESLSDRVPPLDKRYLLNALLFDHTIEWVKENLKSIGRLIGSASIKQGYLVTKADGTHRALKYIRSLARYEVQENMAIAKSVISAQQKKRNGFNNISDNLLDELDAAVQRELDMPNEVKNQEEIGGFSRGESFGGWTLDVPRVDKSLEGTQFFADEFITGDPLKEEMINHLKNQGEYENVAGLIYRALFREILLFGRYHADLQPGNIFVDPQTKTVRFLDFGNTAFLSEENQNTFVLLLAALKSRNAPSAMAQFLKMTGNMIIDPAATEEINKIVSGSKDVEQALRGLKGFATEHSLIIQGEFEILFKVFETIKYISGSVLKKQSETILKQAIIKRQLSPSHFFSRFPTTLQLLLGLKMTLGQTPSEQGARLPDVRRLEVGTYTPLTQELENEVARYEVRIGGDTFIIAHSKSDPLGEEGTVFEFLRVLEFSRDGINIEIPRGTNGIWEFTARREQGKTVQIDSEQMSGIPHKSGEAPYLAGTALMAVMLKEVAGQNVPIVGVLAIKNAAALEREILKSREETRPLTFKDLQNIPAFRDPECEYTLRIDDEGAARYTKTWRGQNFNSRLDEGSILQIRDQRNYDAFLQLQNQIREELAEGTPAATISGVVRFIRVVMVGLVKLFPKTEWARGWKKLSHQGKLDRIIRVYAPFVESFFMGAAYWGITLLAQVALPLMGLDPGLISNVTILSVLNVVFGLLHTEVYRMNPATGNWELQRATFGTRMGIAVTGLAIHSPLLFSTLNPILAPLALIGGNLTAGLLSGFFHRIKNDLFVSRSGKTQVTEIAKVAARNTLAEQLRINLLGNSGLNLNLSELTKTRLSPLIAQIGQRDVTEDKLIDNLKTIGQEESIKPVLRYILIQLKNTTSSLVAGMFEFAGARWAQQTPGPLAIAMHDWSEWQNNTNYVAFLKGAVRSATNSNREIIIAAPTDQQKQIQSHFQLPSNTTFREKEIQSQFLDAGEFAKAAGTKSLLAANANRIINTSGLYLFYLEVLSRALAKEIEWLKMTLQQA